MDTKICLSKMNSRQYFLRERTYDFDIVFESSVYREFCHFTKSDVWLDAGAHIGSFSVQFSPFVKKIIAFEPEESNLTLLQVNCHINNVTNVIPYGSAIIGGNNRKHMLRVCSGKNTGGHSFYSERGKKVIVPCRNINTQIRKHNINKIKLNICGEEERVLYAIEEWGSIDEIIFRWNFHILRDSGERYKHVVKFLRYIFPKVLAPEFSKSQKYAIVHCRKYDQ